jgi:hypothetical protein
VAWAAGSRLLWAALAVLAVHGCGWEVIVTQDLEFKRHREIEFRGPSYAGRPWWEVGKDGVPDGNPK